MVGILRLLCRLSASPIRSTGIFAKAVVFVHGTVCNHTEICPEAAIPTSQSGFVSVLAPHCTVSVIVVDCCMVPDVAVTVSV